MPRKKKLQPSSSDLARARATMRTLGVATLYGNGDGAYFRTLEAATAYNGSTPSSLITYLLD